MGFRLEIWTRCLLAAVVALAAVCSAGAQPASRRPGEAILFSSPDGDEVSSNLPSLTATPPVLLNPIPSAQAPSLDFRPPSQSEPLPLPPMIAPAQSQRMQRQLDEQRNWALMTPEQILGVPTAEKILGVQDRDAFGRPKNPTVVEQFYERQGLARARTNNFAVTNSTSRWATPDNGEEQWNSKFWNPAAGGPANSTLLNQFLKGTSDKTAGSSSAQVPAGDWFKGFSAFTPPSRSAAEQQATAKQFQQLLQSQSSSDEAARVSAFDGPVYSTRPSAPSASAQFTPPIGESYPPLTSGIGMPTGVQPLPGLLGQTNKFLAPAPDWKLQTAPWLSPAPQLGVAPQRKF